MAHKKERQLGKHDHKTVGIFLLLAGLGMLLASGGSITGNAVYHVENSSGGVLAVILVAILAIGAFFYFKEMK